MANHVELTRRRFLVGSIAAGAAAAAPLGWYGAFYEANDVEIVRRDIAIRNLPKRLDGLTTVQVSDLHVNGEVTEAHHRMVDLVQQLRPGLIVVTGDVVDVDTSVDDGAALINSLRAPLGTWAVPGNRDHLAEAVYPLSQALATRDAHLLVNRSAQVEDGFWLIGVDDPSEGRDDLHQALQHVPAEGVRLLLAHSPNIVGRIGGTRFDLVLAGHTHGGQVNLPLVRDNWLRDEPARRYPAGLYQTDSVPLYVNRGIGTYYLPLRFGSRPEITAFTFHVA